MSAVVCAKRGLSSSRVALLEYAYKFHTKRWIIWVDLVVGYFCVDFSIRKVFEFLRGNSSDSKIRVYFCNTFTVYLATSNNTKTTKAKQYICFDGCSAWIRSRDEQVSCVPANQPLLISHVLLWLTIDSYASIYSLLISTGSVYVQKVNNHYSIVGCVYLHIVHTVYVVPYNNYNRHEMHVSVYYFTYMHVTAR